MTYDMRKYRLNIKSMTFNLRHFKYDTYMHAIKRARTALALQASFEIRRMYGFRVQHRRYVQG
jgi:hypothetical protein